VRSRVGIAARAAAAGLATQYSRQAHRPPRSKDIGTAPCGRCRFPVIGSISIEFGGLLSFFSILR